MTDNINWQSQPEATHYKNGCWFRAEGDDLFFSNKSFGWCETSVSYLDQSNPRPAQSRNWQDPAMWFDAPDWAECVQSLTSKSGDLEYIYRGCGRCVYVGTETDANIFRYVDHETIATRPKQEKPTLNDMLEGVKPDMFTEEYSDAIIQLRKQAEALNKAADYLESLQ